MRKGLGTTSLAVLVVDGVRVSPLKSICIGECMPKLVRDGGLGRAGVVPGGSIGAAGGGVALSALEVPSVEPDDVLAVVGASSMVRSARPRWGSG